jgi:hypothetical protein
VSFRHEDSSGFVPRVDDLDAKFEAGIVDRHDLISRQGKNPARPGRFERLCKKIRAAHHKVPFMIFLVRAENSIVFLTVFRLWTATPAL